VATDLLQVIKVRTDKARPPVGMGPLHHPVVGVVTSPALMEMVGMIASTLAYNVFQYRKGSKH